AEMKQFLEVIKLILSSVGINILDSKKKLRKDTEDKKEQMIFEFKLKGAQAQMIIEDDQFVILEGSTAVRNYRPSASDSIKKMRESLISKNILKLSPDGEYYVFEENYAFNSPSYAASAIAGGHENGRRQWKHKGKNMNQLEAEEIR